MLVCGIQTEIRMLVAGFALFDVRELPYRATAQLRYPPCTSDGSTVSNGAAGAIWNGVCRTAGSGYAFA